MSYDESPMPAPRFHIYHLKPGDSSLDAMQALICMDYPCGNIPYGAQICFSHSIGVWFMRAKDDPVPG